MLDGLIERICLVWVDDVVLRGQTAKQSVSRLEPVVVRPEEHDLFVAAQKCYSIAKYVRWPEHAAEPQQDAHTVNVMRTVVYNVVKVKAPLRNPLEEYLKHPSRTKMVTTRRAMTDKEWIEEQL